ncbi:transposase [Thomasclavelia spiroformis]|uniref:transposase n=1 Tax=Thomasclavelia spiroformis TaxID=29348 RepID=UPI002941FCE5|nr:transposase [Thomasclavelia spiroformis]
MFNTEFDEHMGYDKYDQMIKKDNYRNGSFKKTIKTLQGYIDINILQDRNVTFDSEIIEKYNKDILKSENKIINLYARGMFIRILVNLLKIFVNHQ